MKFDFSDDGRKAFYREFNKEKDELADKIENTKNLELKKEYESLYKKICENEKMYSSTKKYYFSSLENILTLKYLNMESTKADKLLYDEEKAKKLAEEREDEITESENALREVSIDYDRDFKEYVMNLHKYKK